MDTDEPTWLPLLLSYLSSLEVSTDRLARRVTDLEVQIDRLDRAA